ncbi:MAG TPA: hypothetical protein VNK46_03730 [Nitrospiraceae bacterium]|nr:hypothetical protein [Nitrospiraceae bacterium]
MISSLDCRASRLGVIRPSRKPAAKFFKYPAFCLDKPAVWRTDIGVLATDSGVGRLVG